MRKLKNPNQYATNTPNATVRKDHLLKDIKFILYYELSHEYLSFVDSMYLLQLKKLLLKSPLNLAIVTHVKYMQSIIKDYKKNLTRDSPLKKYLDQIEGILEIEAKAQEDKLSEEKKQEEKKLEPTVTQSGITPTEPVHKPEKNQSATLEVKYKVTNDHKETKKESQNEKHEEEKKPLSLEERLEKISQCLPQQNNKLNLLLTIVKTINDPFNLPAVSDFSGTQCNLYRNPRENIPVGFSTILGYIDSLVSDIEKNPSQNLSKVIDQYYNLVATLWTQKKRESKAQNEKIQSSCCFGGLYSFFYSRKQVTRDVYTSLEVPTISSKI